MTDFAFFYSSNKLLRSTTCTRLFLKSSARSLVCFSNSIDRVFMRLLKFSKFFLNNSLMILRALLVFRCQLVALVSTVSISVYLQKILV